MRIVAILGVLLVAACGATGGAAASRPSPSAHATPTPVATALETPTAVASASSEPASAPRTEPPQPSPTPPMPAVQCAAGVVPTSQAVVYGASQWILYDVTNPMQPRVVCRAANTSVHIVTGTSFEYLQPRVDGNTDVVLHALGSNNETVVATFRADLSGLYFSAWTPIAWSPSLSAMAYSAQGGTDANGLGITDVWLATASGRTKVYSYAVPGIDSFRRPGIPAPALSISADGAYLAAGWAIAVGSIRVFRLSDMANVTPALPKDFRSVLWAKTGHRLFMVGTSSVAEWTPGSAVTTLPNTTGWVLDPNFSPDGTQVAFTGVSTTGQIGANLYDLNTSSSHVLSSQPRSSTIFVKAGWVWYLEEKPCVASANDPCFDPTAPDGKVFAVELRTRAESAVTFASGESPIQPGNFGYMLHGDLWP
ncbi:MAG TPA: WD40 repeat domain-containing protein [Candidatus Dormibacteraeota bacterium]|nr:WD40 repeat domain-containing protein [Candidatus Dormibacteraeota bacterium]